MNPGQVARNLRKLNPRIRVWCGNDDSRPAGVFYLTPSGEYEELCGIDKNDVPEHVEFNPDQSIRKGGWRRVLRVLIQRGLIDRFRAQKLFGTHLAYVKHKKPPVALPNLTQIESKWR